MRFYEFAPAAKPVLKISQPQANTTPTPFPGNAQPTAASAQPTLVYPRAWQREWLQKYLASQIAKDAQTIQPTEVDIVKAYMRFADARRQAEEKYSRREGTREIKADGSNFP